MELRRVAEALVRSQTSPLATFLAPSATLRWTAQGQIRSGIGGNRSIGRQFSSASPRNAVRPDVTTTAAAPAKDTESTTTMAGSDSNSIESITESLGWASRPRAPQSGPIAVEREKRFNGGDTAADLLSAMNSKFAPRQPSTGKRAFDLSRMLTPGDLSPTERELSQAVLGSSVIHESPPRTPMKLGPSTGRTVQIGSGNVDIGRGFALLNMSCARNKVMRDVGRQRFHERGGLKRKRLRRERWRKKFMEGFKAAVGRVKALKKQGW